MSDRDKELVLRGEKLRSLIELPTYIETVGAWIDGLLNDSLTELDAAIEPNEILRAQGKFRAAYQLTSLIKGTLDESDAAKNRVVKANNRVMKNDDRSKD